MTQNRPQSKRARRIAEQRTQQYRCFSLRRCLYGFVNGFWRAFPQPPLSGGAGSGEVRQDPLPLSPLPSPLSPLFLAVHAQPPPRVARRAGRGMPPRSKILPHPYPLTFRTAGIKIALSATFRGARYKNGVKCASKRRRIRRNPGPDRGRFAKPQLRIATPSMGLLHAPMRSHI